MFIPSLPLRDIMLVNVIMPIKCSVFLQMFQCKFYICKLYKIISWVISFYIIKLWVAGKLSDIFLLVLLSYLLNLYTVGKVNKLKSYQLNWARF